MEKETSNLFRQVKKHLAAIATRGDMLKGSVSKVSLGKMKRKDGERTAYLLTWKDETNKTKTVYISEEDQPEIRQKIANYKKNKQALEKIVQLNVRLFKLGKSAKEGPRKS